MLPYSRGVPIRQHVRFKAMQISSSIKIQIYSPRICRRGRTARRSQKRQAVRCKAALVNTPAMVPALQAAWGSAVWLIHSAARFLREPPGGYPIGVATWLPGWQRSLERGPRRWLGLRPGRQQPVPVPGAWFTPSGFVETLRQVPLGIWLVLAVYCSIRLIEFAKQRRKERDEWIKQKTLIAAAKSSDLLVQKNRMMRALGNAPEAEGHTVDVLPVVNADEVEWRDPGEWQPGTWKQWADFMQKSRALQLQKDRWWDVDMMENTPHHKTAYDQLESSGQLPDYNEWPDPV